MSKGEIWTPYSSRYTISSHGRVKSGDKFLSPRKVSGGYIGYTLHGRQLLAHRIVAEYFIGPCPNGCEVNHKDGDKSNNEVSNLEYVTRSENMIHAFTTGLFKPAKGDGHYRSRLTSDDVAEIRLMYANGAKQAEIANRFGVRQDHVSRIVNNKVWKNSHTEE